MKKSSTRIALGIALALAANAGTALADGPKNKDVMDNNGPACGALAAAMGTNVPGVYAKLKNALDLAVAAEGSGLNLNMWATLVSRDGLVCAVAFSGADRGAQWPGSRAISAQKANTANAFSLDGLALSTANLYSAVQPGGSLYGLQHSNPVDTAVAYKGPAKNFGQPNDPMVGQRPGGVNVFGGGLGLHLRRQQPGLEEGAWLGREQHRAVLLQHIERLDAERVADQPCAAVPPHQAQGVHAAQALEGGGTFLLVQVQQGLEIRAGREHVLQAERGGQLDIVIDLAIADDGRSGRMQRLPAALQVDDRQPGVGEGQALMILHPHPVGAAVGQGLDHRARRPGPVQHPGYAAHQPAP